MKHGDQESSEGIRGHDMLDIHVSVHHDIIYENDQQDATV